MVSLLAKTILFIILIPGSHDQEKQTRVAASSVIRYGDITFSTNRILKTSPGLFSILNFDLISAKNSGITGQTDGIILPVKTKTRIFGNSQALGKTITVDSHPYEIVGIVKDIPEKSCLSCDLVILRAEMEMSVESLINIRCMIIQ